MGKIPIQVLLLDRGLRADVFVVGYAKIYIYTEQTRDETSNYDKDQWLKVQKHSQRYHYDYAANTVIPPSVFVATMLWAAGPHATAVAEAALLNGSDHCLLDLVYC